MSVTRTPAADAIYLTKSQPFSIIWGDNTDSEVNRRRLMQFVQNFEQGLYKPSTSIIQWSYSPLFSLCSFSPTGSRIAGTCRRPAAPRLASLTAG